MNECGLARQWLVERSARCAVLLFLSVVVGACGSDTSPSSHEPASLQHAITPDSLTISRMLETDDRFSTLRTALDSTGLDSLLATSGPYTLFAPPNKAFEALPPGTMETLLGDRHDRLRTILAHHVVKGRISTEGRSTSRTISTLSGDTLVLQPADTGMTVGGVTIVDGDIKAANGFIHVVNRVLPPPTAN